MDLEKITDELQNADNAITEIENKVLSIQASGEAGGGLVIITLDGKKQVIGLKLDVSTVESHNKTMLEDLLVAAFNFAIKKIDRITKEAVRKEFKTLFPTSMMNLF